MKKYIINAVIVCVMVVLASSCKKDNIPAGGTAVQNLAGDWHVKVKDNSGYYITMYTYNTSDNSSTLMWIETDGLTDNNIHVSNAGGLGLEPGLPLGVKGKVNVDVASQTFSGTNIVNENFNPGGDPPNNIAKFSVANGKVVSNGTTGPGSNTPTDAISFDLIVDGVTYKVSGYHRTGFLEDLPATEKAPKPPEE